MKIISYIKVLSWSNGEGNVLHVAARRNATEFLQVLLSPNRKLASFALYPADIDERRESDPLFRLIGIQIDEMSKMGNTPLHVAAACGHADSVRLLLAAGAHDTLQNEKGLTPLELAQKGGHSEVAAVLGS
jgi:ankyrin repeat protein